MLFVGEILNFIFFHTIGFDMIEKTSIEPIEVEKPFDVSPFEAVDD
jgi:hypothetical protein